MGKSINLAGQRLPALGQGTWYMGEDPAKRHQEVTALQAGIDLGLRLIDTAEMYAEGGAERVVGEAIRGRRDQAFIVSKVYPWNAAGTRGVAACEASLKRLGTDHIDLYLLHWSGDIPLEETLTLMSELQRQGKIGRWGVSNLDIDEMRTLWALAGGEACATDQVLYHLASRGIETDLLPWCREQEMPVMAYCPLAQAGRQRQGLMQHPLLVEQAQMLGISVAQLLLAWVIRRPGVIAIPKSASLAHVRDNAAALEISLSDALLSRLDEAFPAPTHKGPLDIV